MRTETAKQIYENMGIETSQIPDTGEWVASQNGGHQISLKEYKANGRVPDVRGMSARDAVNLLEEMGVNVHVSGIGKVESQSLAPGYSIGKGARITLFLNR
jgi:cell division protein FtsI (penicillin-binding protein 3)